MPHLLPSKPWIWPLLVGGVSLVITGWLWQHERETELRSLRSSFNAGLRQTATRIEERVTSYEQMLRGVRGLFDASARVTPDDFARYVDALATGADFAGLRSIAHAPLRNPGAADDGALSASIALIAPAADPAMQALGADPLADPPRRAAMLQARDSGGVVITERLRFSSAPASDAAFVLCMPQYARGQPLPSVAARRAHLVGWVLASFRIADLMGSLYGEVAPGLDVRLHDGHTLSEASRIHPAGDAGSAPQPAHAARFEAQEYLAVAGHTWTLRVRSSPEFEQRFSSNAALIIAVAGTGLSLMLALLTWQLVTGRERARARALVMTRQLRDSAAQYRRIVETASEGIWMVDAQARTLFVNPKLQQMLGYTEDGLLGRRWTDFMDEPSRTALAKAAAGPQPGGLAEHLDIGFLRQDGSVMSATLSTSTIRDEAGQPTGALAMVTDVTDRKLAEAQHAQLEALLRQAQKMEAIGTLAGGIAHDFNNILMGILGNADLALMDLPENAEVRRNIERIVTSSQRAADLCRQMLAYSGRGSFVIQPLNLSDLLNEMQHFLAVSVSKDVETVYELAEEIPAVEADATQLRQIIMNLVINASDAIGAAGGRIRIRTGARKCATEELRQSYLREELPPGLYVYIQVEDNGAGMDDETIKRIFDPFFTTKFQGRGLGLAAVLGIVRAHRGAIRVSSARGVGSTFTVFLPASTRAAESLDRIPPPEAPVRGTGTVLFVDDEESVREVGRAILHKAGFTVLTARDGEEALDVYTQQHDRIDVVVLDLTMPRRSGLETLKALRSVRNNVRVIISSGYSEDESVNQFEKRDLAGFIQKPYRPIDLTAKIHDALKSP